MDKVARNGVRPRLMMLGRGRECLAPGKRERIPALGGIKRHAGSRSKAKVNRMYVCSTSDTGHQSDTNPQSTRQ